MHSPDRLLRALENVLVEPFSGFVYRIIAERHRDSPLSAIGSVRSGGRYNAPNTFPMLYCADTRQWINPSAFVSVVDPMTGGCTGGDSIVNCQFGDSGRNSVRGPHFTDSDIYITKTFKLHEGLTFRFDTQMFNAFNHANFALPSNVEAGVPGGLIPARFGTLQSTISPPTGLLGVGLGGDSSPRMISFQGRLKF